MPKVKNEFLKTDDPETMILRIRLNSGEVFDILFDSEDLELLKDYHWSMTSDKLYARCTMEKKHNRKQIRLHKLLLPNVDLVDHKDRNTLNCRKSNLRESNYLENNRNKSKCIRNKSGRTGVYKRTKKGNDFWVAEWADNKVKKQKWFSINLYGNENAFNMASAKREEMENLLQITSEK
jgi:hypothetical protein